MAKIVTITNPLTGQPAQVDQLDHTAQQIDDGLNIARGVSNPNLLDNWYFGNPVNQRGIASGEIWGGGNFGIDRWCAFTSGLYWDSNGYIVFPPGISSNVLYQRIEKSKFIIGSKLTLSILTDDGNLISGTKTYTGNTIYGILYGTIFSDSTISVADKYVSANIWYSSANQIGCNVIAAKLELGSQQTLAHQENGVWVLNEIPDYGEQLRQCQYYFHFFTDIEVPLSNNPAGTYITGTLPLTMRSGTGAIKYNTGHVFFGNGDYQAITSASVDSDGGRVKIGVNVGNSINGNLSATLHLTNCSIIFDM